MAICDLKNPDLKKITDSKADLKSKMTEGLAGLGSMEDIQKKMNDGFKGLTTGATGPATVCQCSGGDPLASTEEECLATGGSWVCKEVENFNLQQELLALNDKSPIDFAAGVQGIKEKFGGLVPDLTDKIKTIAPAMGDFFENFQMPALPKAGDTVLNCSCTGGDPLASTESECLDSGGSWVCTEEVLQADLGEMFGSKLQGGIGSITSFFGGAGGGTVGSTGGIPSLSDAFSKFSTAIKGAEIPSFPKPGELALVCNCVGGDASAMATNEADCILAGGKWECSMQPAPDIPNIFGGDGLPKISKDTLCQCIDNVEVKDVVKTDPQTGFTSIEKVADVLPKEPSPPTVAPAPPAPAPTTNTTNKNAFGGAQVAESMAQKTLKDTAIKTSIKYGIDETRYTILYLWIYREMLYRKAGLGSVDDYATSSYQWLWANPLTIDKKEATIRWKEWQVASAKAKNKEVSTTTLDEKVNKLWPAMVKIYSETERTMNRRDGTEYLGERGWIKFLKDSWVKYNKSSENKAATKIQVAAEKPAAEKPIGSQVTAVPATKVPDIATKAEIGEQPDPPTGQKCIVVTSSRKSVCFDQAVFEYTKAGAWKHVPTSSFLPNITSQEELDGVAKAIKSKGTFELVRNGRNGITVELFSGSDFSVKSNVTGKKCVKVGKWNKQEDVCYDTSEWSYDDGIGVFTWKATGEYFDFSDQGSFDKVTAAIKSGTSVQWRAYYAPTGTAKLYELKTDGTVEAIRILRPGE